MPAPFDQFGLQTTDVDDPAKDAFAVTPDNATFFTQAARALYVGGTGDITLVTAAGTAVQFVGVPAGVILPVRCSRVNSTGTTATSIVGLV